jgi:Na+/H+-dicarboxylate symporter
MSRTPFSSIVTSRSLPEMSVTSSVGAASVPTTWTVPLTVLIRSRLTVSKVKVVGSLMVQFDIGGHLSNSVVDSRYIATVAHRDISRQAPNRGDVSLATADHDYRSSDVREW